MNENINSQRRYTIPQAAKLMTLEPATLRRMVKDKTVSHWFHPMRPHCKFILQSTIDEFNSQAVFVQAKLQK